MIGDDDFSDFAVITPPSTYGVDDAEVFVFMKAGKFLQVEDPPIEHIIEGILSDEGGGWLGGEEKLGKTYYALHEALCLAFGLEVCGRFRVPKRRRVMIIEEEDPPRRVRRRLRVLLRGLGFDPTDSGILAELDAWLRIEVWGGFKVDIPHKMAQLEQAISEYRPDVIYIDAFRKITRRSMSKQEEMEPVLDQLDELRRKYGVIFRVIHHNRKNQGFRTGRSSQEISGSFVLGAWGENSLFFEPVGKKQGPVRVTVQSKDGAPTPPFKLVITGEGPDLDPTKIVLTAEDDDAEAKASEHKDAVLDAIAALPPEKAKSGNDGVSLKSIIAVTKLSNRTVRRCIDDLTDEKRCLVTGYLAKQAKLYGVNEQ